MKFSISKESLSTALNVISKGMSSRSTLPILSGILITGKADQVIFQTTDLEISIKHQTSANLEEDGQIVVPGKLFGDIVKSLPDAVIEVSGGSDHAQIDCMGSTFKLSTLNPSDFPYFPEVSSTRKLTLDADMLYASVRKVGKAVSHDESRAIFTGILFSVDGDEVRLAATDSYRLAVADIHTATGAQEPFQAIIPGKIFEEVTRLASGGQMEIGFADNQIVFEFANTVFVSRRIEGTYPNYQQLIPTEKTCAVKVDTSELISAIKRISLLATMSQPIRLAFSNAEQKITISARTQDVGGASEKLDCTIEGEDVEIGFSPHYILDGLSSVGETALIELVSSLKPAVVKSFDSEEFLYLAMPVRLS